MGVSLVITSANVTEIPYMEVLKIVVSAMFGFRHFIRQYWSCMLPCMLNELLMGVNMVLAKDDVRSRSRSRVVVNIVKCCRCNKAEASPFFIIIVAVSLILTTVVYIVFRSMRCYGNCGVFTYFT